MIFNSFFVQADDNADDVKTGSKVSMNLRHIKLDFKKENLQRNLQLNTRQNIGKGRNKIRMNGKSTKKSRNYIKGTIRAILVKKKLLTKKLKEMSSAKQEGKS